ncbi:MAG: hypothetical protein IJ740_08875 [Ruminococcus sp.]|nr:hypothetical protein [Ruminococcus sp.]
MSKNTILYLGIGYIVLIAICFKSLSNPRSGIKLSVILRLVMNAGLSFVLAMGYSDDVLNVRRVFFDGGNIWWVIAVIFIDSLAAICWQYGKRFWLLHLFAFILLGGIAYIVFIQVALGLYGGMSVLAGLILMPFLWVAGLIPMISTGMAYRKIRKASEQEN